MEKETKKKYHRFHLKVDFKPGGKHPEWSYIEEYLMGEYARTNNIKFRHLGEAVDHKIARIKHRCIRIVLYDNRPGTQFPIMLEILNGQLIVDNRKRSEELKKQRKKKRPDNLENS